MHVPVRAMSLLDCLTQVAATVVRAVAGRAVTGAWPVVTALMLIGAVANSEPGEAAQPQILLVDKTVTAWDSHSYSKAQAAAARVGAKLTLVVGYKGQIPRLRDFAGVIVMAGGGGHNERSYGMIDEEDLITLRTYVVQGGRLCVFVLPRLSHYNPTLQDAFGIMVAEENIMTPGRWEIHLDGHRLCPLWSGLTVGSNHARRGDDPWSPLGLRSYFEVLDREHQVTTLQSESISRERATSVQGSAGRGQFLFITSFSTGGGGIMYRHVGNMLTNDSIDHWDNQLAAERLMEWLGGATPAKTGARLSGSAGGLSIYLDGVRTDADARVIGGTTYVPLRALAEMLGLQVEYDPERRRIDLRR